MSRTTAEAPALMLIGPVTSCRTMLENAMRSKREPAPPWNLKGQPYTWCRTQFETVTFSAMPPPKRNTDQRVLNVELVTATNLQLPNNAHASSCVWTLQLSTVTYSQ